MRISKKMYKDLEKRVTSLENKQGRSISLLFNAPNCNCNDLIVKNNQGGKVYGVIA